MKKNILSFIKFYLIIMGIFLFVIITSPEKSLMDIFIFWCVINTFFMVFYMIFNFLGIYIEVTYPFLEEPIKKKTNIIKKLKKLKFYSEPCGKWKDVEKLKEIVKELEDE